MGLAEVLRHLPRLLRLRRALLARLLRDPRVDPRADHSAALRYSAEHGHVTVVGLLLQYQNARTALAGLEQLMANPQERNPQRVGLHRPVLSGQIEFRGVGFAYPGRDDKVLDNAPERRTVVQADVRASGVVHAETDRVNVLLFVNQTTTSTANPGEPQTALNRVVMQMARSGDTWLVDDITTY